MTRPVVAVVVAFHGPEQLGRCLTALGGDRLKATVVDNSSSAAVRSVVLRHAQTYVDPGANLGFASGVNVALRILLAGSPHDVLLLNPDAVIDGNAVTKLSDFLHASGDRVAAVAPRLMGIGQAEQRVMWPFPSPLRHWGEAIGLGRLLRQEDFAIGAVLLLRWEALREVGLFDERFFLYAEEADWQRRARDRGWSTRLCIEAVASHAGGGASSDGRRREALFHAAQETYIRKWFGAAGWWVYRGAAVAGASARTLLLVGERRTEAARRVLLYARGPRRCAGLGHGF